jgi:hypothetical protein
MTVSSRAQADTKPGSKLALICRISRAFERNLLAWQLRHAGAQAVDVPIGARKVSRSYSASVSV